MAVTWLSTNFTLSIRSTFSFLRTTRAITENASCGLPTQMLVICTSSSGSMGLIQLSGERYAEQPLCNANLCNSPSFGTYFWTLVMCTPNWYSSESPPLLRKPHVRASSWSGEPLGSIVKASLNTWSVFWGTVEGRVVDSGQGESGMPCSTLFARSPVSTEWPLGSAPTIIPSG